MKYFTLFWFISLSLLSAEKENMAGSFVHRPSGSNYKKFFVFESKGRKLAFPVVFKNKKSEDLVSKNPSGFFLIKSSYKTTKLQLDGVSRKTLVLDVDEVKQISLKNLRPNKFYPKKAVGKGEGYHPQGIEVSDDVQLMNPQKGGLISFDGINDTVTNTAIAVGAVAILADILLK